MNKYTKTHKLKEMLDNENIPHYFISRGKDFTNTGIDWGYQICYPQKGFNQICSAVQGYGTYGAENDLIEIMGLLTDKENAVACVKGYLTAEDVFARIKEHYNENKE